MLKYLATLRARLFVRASTLSLGIWSWPPTEMLVQRKKKNVVGHQDFSRLGPVWPSSPGELHVEWHKPDKAISSFQPCPYPLPLLSVLSQLVSSSLSLSFSLSSSLRVAFLAACSNYPHVLGVSYSRFHCLICIACHSTKLFHLGPCELQTSWVFSVNVSLLLSVCDYPVVSELVDRIVAANHFGQWMVRLQLPLTMHDHNTIFCDTCCASSSDLPSTSDYVVSSSVFPI